MKCINNNRKGSFQKVLCKLCIWHMYMAKQKPCRLQSYKSQRALPKTLGSPVSILWIWKLTHGEGTWQVFYHPKGSWMGRDGRSLVICSSCPVLCLPCQQEMSAVLCLSLIWPTSSQYFPLNSCLSSTVVWWDGDSHHYMHQKDKCYVPV